MSLKKQYEVIVNKNVVLFVGNIFDVSEYLDIPLHEFWKIVNQEKKSQYAIRERK